MPECVPTDDTLATHDCDKCKPEAGCKVPNDGEEGCTECQSWYVANAAAVKPQPVNSLGEPAMSLDPNTGGLSFKKTEETYPCDCTNLCSTFAKKGLEEGMEAGDDNL